MDLETDGEVELSAAGAGDVSSAGNGEGSSAVVAGVEELFGETSYYNSVSMISILRTMMTCSC